MGIQTEKLRQKRFEVQLLVGEATKNAKIVEHDVEVWTTKVYENEDQSRYELSMRGNKITQDIVALLNEGLLNIIAYARPSRKEYLPSIEDKTFIFDDQGDTVSLDFVSAKETFNFQDQGDRVLDLTPQQPCRHLIFNEIQSATQNLKDAFDIGNDGFGKVYKGFIDNGATVVGIKRLDPMTIQGDTKFRTEIKMLSRF
ncbi:hypothetical protein LguiA_010564 [Lonicera macranthoides]